MLVFAWFTVLRGILDPVLVARALAPVDDEPETPEEMEAVAEGIADVTGDQRAIDFVGSRTDPLKINVQINPAARKTSANALSNVHFEGR